MMGFLKEITMMRRSILFLSSVLCLWTSCGSLAFAQGARDDYERAAKLAEATRDTLFRHQVDPEWAEDGKSFWYRVQMGRDQYRFIWVDAERGMRRELFDHDRLAAALQEGRQEPVSGDHLPFATLKLELVEGNPRAIEFNDFGQRWRCDLTTYELKSLSEKGENATTVRVLTRPRRSRPNGVDTSIRLTNNWTEPLRLFWVDRGAQRVAYGDLAPGATREQHTFGGHVWLVVDDKQQVRGIFEATDEPGQAVIDGTWVEEPEGTAPADENSAMRFGTSPDGKWIASVRDGNVWLKRAEEDQEVALTTDGNEEARFIPEFHWSPDSSRLVCVQEVRGDERKVHLIESSPTDQLQPKLHELAYDKPGDNLPVTKLRLFAVAETRAIPLADSLYPNPWSLSEIRWAPDSKSFSFMYNQRGHQVLRLVRIDAETGEASLIIDETSDTFVDYAHKVFLEHLDETNEILWMSERDGWNHLYLYDSANGVVKNQVTSGSWVVRQVERVDREKRQIWFFASGFFSQQDPYLLYLCRVDFDGQNFTVLTPAHANHRVDFSPDRRYLLDHYSRIDLPPVTELRHSETGDLICELERADVSQLLSSGWRPPVPFAAPGRDGETMIYGVIYLPQAFDPEKKYPVIERIYAGPQDNYVPKEFRSYFDEQALAELGFIVVQMDGMGTSNRSKSFHDVCWKNLGDAGFPDRIAWLQAAAKDYPAMDLTRVGIYGGSAGGQNALRGLLMHPDHYHVGVADCGCHDNRMDKVWWNELWMGWPLGPHYEEQSNVTQAHRLQGKLLLTVGELDRNVDPASTMQVVNALIKADKDFDLLIVPGSDHGAGERPYAKRRRQDFFVRHLLGVEPRWEKQSSGD